MTEAVDRGHFWPAQGDLPYADMPLPATRTILTDPWRMTIQMLNSASLRKTLPPDLTYVDTIPEGNKLDMQSETRRQGRLHLSAPHIYGKAWNNSCDKIVFLCLAASGLNYFPTEGAGISHASPVEASEHPAREPLLFCGP